MQEFQEITILYYLFSIIYSLLSPQKGKTTREGE
jgi:hypothetical protein